MCPTLYSLWILSLDDFISIDLFWPACVIIFFPWVLPCYYLIFFCLKLHEALDNKFLTFVLVLFTVLLVGDGQHLCQPDHLLLDECQVLFQEQTELPLVVSIKGFGTTLTRSFLAAHDSCAGPRRDKKSMRCLLTLQRHWIICKIPQNILTTPSPFYDSLILDLFVSCHVAPLWWIGQGCPNWQHMEWCILFPSEISSAKCQSQCATFLKNRNSF